jgi:tripartite-type tricarboxylate transporter receptor subunit TctC
VDKLSRETLAALKVPAVRGKLAALGVDPMVMSPARFATYVDSEIVLNAELARKAGLKAQ